jgi:hypothetical protein
VKRLGPAYGKMFCACAVSVLWRSRRDREEHAFVSIVIYDERDFIEYSLSEFITSEAPYEYPINAGAVVEDAIVVA